MQAENKTISLKINGKSVRAEEGESLLDCASDHEIFIPSLCEMRGLSTIGACRLCIVEVKGVPRLLSACVTKVAEGMDVQTNTPKVLKYRKMILELLFAERNHICAVCVSNGCCELQTLARQLGVEHVRYAYRYPRIPVDATHRRFSYDANRCVLCRRCARVCEEVEGARTWNTRGRGIRSMMMTDMDQPWGESESCTTCGKCVQVCPTGALFEKGDIGSQLLHKENILPYLKNMRTSGR